MVTTEERAGTKRAAESRGAGAARSCFFCEEARQRLRRWRDAYAAAKELPASGRELERIGERIQALVLTLDRHSCDLPDTGTRGGWR